MTHNTGNFSTAPGGNQGPQQQPTDDVAHYRPRVSEVGAHRPIPFRQPSARTHYVLSRQEPFQRRRVRALSDARELLRPVLAKLFPKGTIIDVEGNESDLGRMLDQAGLIDALYRSNAGQLYGISYRLTHGMWDSLTISTSQCARIKEAYGSRGAIYPSLFVQGYVGCRGSGERYLRSLFITKASDFLPYISAHPGDLLHAHGRSFVAWGFAELLSAGIGLQLSNEWIERLR